MRMGKPKILLVAEYFVPSKKAGGTVTEIENIAETYAPVYDVCVLTVNHDFGTDVPFAGIEPNVEIKVNGFKVIYSTKSFLRLSKLKKFCQGFNLIVGFGLYSKLMIKTLFVHRMSLKNIPLVVVPVGSLRTSSLQIKKLKKQIFLCSFRCLSFFNNTIWAFSSEMDRVDSLKNLRCPKARSILVTDVPTSFRDSFESKPRHQIVKFCFFSRIVPVKNLLYIIEALKFVHGDVEFSIGGTIENEAYWEQCLEESKKLPDNIRVKYCGFFSPSESRNFLRDQDFLILPSKGEGYGYVILEALSVGTVPIISDQTYWNDIQKTGAGFVLPLSSKEVWSALFEKCIVLKNDEYLQMSSAAIKRYLQEVNSYKINGGYTKLFSSILGNKNS
jgi:glycosyltransferase involved in cell wall biosynthesis